MSNKNLFKEAIADAKAVREAALANAKAALEEALTPKLQSMLAAKLNEMEYEEEGLEEYAEMQPDRDMDGDGDIDADDVALMKEDDMEEGFGTNQFMWTDEDNSDTDQNKMDENLEEDFDLSEILAELDEDYSLEEGKDEDEDKKKKKKKMMKEAEDEDEEEGEDEEEVADMTVEDLKALIKDIVNQEMEAEEAETPADEESEETGDDMSMDMGGDESSDEINLDELLAELDALGEADDKEEKIKEGVSLSPAFLSALVHGIPKAAVESCRQSSKTREEYLNCIEAKGGGFAQSGTAGTTGPLGKEYVKEESTLKEAIKTINTLRNELNEVNLLNAKLLYVNKIFKAKNLTESQKLQVIASFDKATTAKEAKVVYESLNATLTTATAKKQIKESLGFASKAAGVAPKKAIVESNDVIARMQKLANIK